VYTKRGMRFWRALVVYIAKNHQYPLPH